MNAGPPSSVCTRLGLIASFSSRVIAPYAFRSLARTGVLSEVSPTMMRASRRSRSSSPVASAMIAMISEPGMITKRSSRVGPPLDRKSTRLNSSHLVISYAVFCLKKKKKQKNYMRKHGTQNISWPDEKELSSRAPPPRYDVTKVSQAHRAMKLQARIACQEVERGP